jgi:hypothetical protein
VERLSTYGHAPDIDTRLGGFGPPFNGTSAGDHPSDISRG